MQTNVSMAKQTFLYEGQDHIFQTLEKAVRGLPTSIEGVLNQYNQLYIVHELIHTQTTPFWVLCVCVLTISSFIAKEFGAGEKLKIALVLSCHGKITTGKLQTLQWRQS